MSKHSQFNWQLYIKENRPDIKLNNFRTWCTRNRPKKQIFDTEQELLETISLYDNKQASRFNWKQYLEYSRPDINIRSFETWCIKYRPKKTKFNTEQELLQTLILYNNRKIYSRFKWRQYLQKNRPDINIESFAGWSTFNRQKKQKFDTEQELVETILLYDIVQKYFIRKTKYQGIYNLTEKETGLKFNFYKLEDMLGLL